MFIVASFLIHSRHSLYSLSRPIIMSSNNAEDENMTTASYLDRGAESATGILNKLFASCAPDPKGSVHRAWGISLIFVVVYFIISVIESTN